jgi:hypothetical protein
MGGTKHFDPDQVQTLFVGVPLEGFAEDSMIDWEWDVEAFKLVRGVDGQITRSKVLGRTATVTVHLMHSSRSNAYLTGIHTQDLLSPGGAGVGPFLIRDGNGASLFATDEAWIINFPNGGYGSQTTPRDWKICCVSPKVIEGGI